MRECEDRKEEEEEMPREDDIEGNYFMRETDEVYEFVLTLGSKKMSRY